MWTSDGTEQGKKLEKYWREIGKNGDQVPHRSDFRITSEIAPLLPFLVIVEAQEDDIVFRLVGTGLAEHQGLDITGRRYGEFGGPGQVDRALARMRVAHALPCGIRTIHTEEYARGIASEVEVAAFPLRGDNGGQMLVMVVTPVGRGIAEKSGKALYLKPLSLIDYIDLGSGVPDDDEVLAGVSGASTAKG